MSTSTARHLVLDLAATSRNWAIDDASAEKIIAAAPADWRVTRIQAPTSSDGDGPKGASEETRNAIADAEIYYGFGITADLVPLAKKLKWVHSAAAGVGNVLQTGIAESDVLLTNSAGIHGPPIAEFVTASVLYFMRGLDVSVDQQQGAEWSKAFFVSSDSPLREVTGSRILIVGTGGLGQESAKRLNALGAICVGFRRRPELGAPEGFSEVYGLGDFERELPGADVVVLAAPLTSETNELLTRARLAMLGKQAIVINVARGAMLDEEALADMVEAGRLRGASLDVFRTEPLAATSRLWQLRSVLVNPHVSPVSPVRFWPRQLDLFLGNWRRYLSGQPLRNLVDKDAGY